MCVLSKSLFLIEHEPDDTGNNEDLGIKTVWKPN